MRKFCFVAALAALLVLASPVANAKGFYVGGSLGQTSADVGASSGNFGGTSVNIDDSATGFKVFGGYNFMKYFAVETAWVDVSEVSIEMSDPTFGDMKITNEANGFSLEAVGILPLGKNQKMQLFAEYGLYLWDGTATFEDSSGSFSAGNDGTDPSYGLGFGWNLAKTASLRFEAERYAIEDLDVDMYSVGFSYGF